jgi:hypothetical protein
VKENRDNGEVGKLIETIKVAGLLARHFLFEQRELSVVDVMAGPEDFIWAIKH